MEQGNLIHVSKSAPCKHCQKPDWCYSIGDLDVCKRDCIADGWEHTSKADKDGKFYLREIQFSKPVRPKQQRSWHYPNRKGENLLRVVRIDDGAGKKKIWQERFENNDWVKGGASRVDIPIYRYQEIRKAIANKETIFIAEGEPTADALSSLGLAATTNVGGAGKWQDSDTQDLIECEQVVLCPDRDKPGLDHARSIAASIRINLPECQIKWLYAPPGKTWDNLPDSGGLDATDWISDNKLTKIDITKTVDESGKVDRIVDALRQPSINQMRHGFEASGRRNRRVDEIQYAVEIEESKGEVEELTIRAKKRLDLADFIHPYLSVGLKQIAVAMPTSPEMLLTTLLPVATSLVGTSATIRIDSGYEWFEPCILWSMAIARTGSLKTPTQKAILKPLFVLQRLANKEYEKAHRQWEEYKKEAEKEKEDFDDPEPIKREYWTLDATMEALIDLHQQNPRGFLRYQDEIDGFYGQLNKYRDGKGDDEQNWLSINGGGEAKVCRLTRKLEMYRTAISMTGSIQPETISKHLGANRDNSGMNARWLYCCVNMPKAYPTDKRVDADIREHLIDVYRKLSAIKPDREEILNDDGEVVGVDVLPKVYFLSDDALHYWKTNWHRPIVDREESETHPGVKAVLAKYRGFCGRIALILHLINHCCSLPTYGQLKEHGIEVDPPREISIDTVKRAIALTEFYINQAKILYGTSSQDPEDWTPAMMRLRQISERLTPDPAHQGWITPKIAKQQTRLIKDAEHAKSVFAQLYEAGFGELDTSGKVPKWRYVSSQDSDFLETPSTRLPVYQSSCKPDETTVSEKEVMSTSPSITPSTSSYDNRNIDLPENEERF